MLFDLLGQFHLGQSSEMESLFVLTGPKCFGKGEKRSLMPLGTDLLENLARKYIWWKTPEEAVARPERIVAQVMASSSH